MKYFSVALIYIAFFALIGVAVWYTSSGWPLFALLLAPTFSEEGCDCKKDSNE